MSVAWYALVWLVLIALSMPVALSLAGVSYLHLALEGGPLLSSVQRMIAGIDSFPLLAVPGFVLAGEIMNKAGVTRYIFRFARALVGSYPGGLGQVNVLASFIASGMSGSAIADAAGMGKMEHHAMKEAGYPDSFSGPLCAASCILGPLIPPSIPLIVYGVIANASVGRLFLAGLVPGVFTAAALMIYVWYVSKKRNYPRDQRMGLREIWSSFLDSVWALFAPVLIIGGIMAGIFTPTEAAGVTALYALLIGLLVYRSIGLSDLPAIFVSAARTTATIGLIIAAANLTSFVLTRQRVPQAVAEWLVTLSTQPLVILLLINLMLLLLGMLMDGMALMILAVPVLLPVTVAVGLDPVHFGVVVIMNIMIGILTPPMGMGLFVISKVTGIPFRTMALGTLPLIVPLILVLLVVTAFPGVVLFVPDLFYGVPPGR